MYQCDWEDSRLILSYTRYGCSHCFDSETQFVKYLQDKGTFKVKGAIALVAEKLAVSEPTIYRYLKKM